MKAKEGYGRERRYLMQTSLYIGTTSVEKGCETGERKGQEKKRKEERRRRGREEEQEEKGGRDLVQNGLFIGVTADLDAEAAHEDRRKEKFKIRKGGRREGGGEGRGRKREQEERGGRKGDIRCKTACPLEFVRTLTLRLPTKTPGETGETKRMIEEKEGEEREEGEGRREKGRYLLQNGLFVGVSAYLDAEGSNKDAWRLGPEVLRVVLQHTFQRASLQNVSVLFFLYLSASFFISPSSPLILRSLCRPTSSYLFLPPLSSSSFSLHTSRRHLLMAG